MSPTSGESSIQTYNRNAEFVEKLLLKNEGTYLIVAHLGTIRNIVAYLLELTIEGTWRFRVENGSITRIVINNEKYAYLTQLGC